ncbi:MAG: glycine dehydrogenase (aminomethyl-transferring), partial [Planctomycetes bacterium]|nr:glycine dehydrogenase (aminomethyl-transferring) [Planctomycetota bacterium]
MASAEPRRTTTFAHPDRFVDRHIGPSADEIAAMLAELGQPSLEALVDAAVPAAIRLKKPLDLPPAKDEHAMLAELRALAGRNRPTRAYLGMGFHGTLTPPVIQRNLLENPGWYTQYTPYQAEIAQGRLESLLNFQTMVGDLTGLPVANASLLDEGTAAAEGMTLAAAHTGRERGATMLVSDRCHPQTIAVLQTRAKPLGIELTVADVANGLPEGEFFGALLQYPAADGAVRDLAPLVEQAKERSIAVAVAADLLALTLMRPPGECGADIVLGTTQRFGVPLGYGGPHAGYLAVRDTLARSLPGRLVGVSVDADGAQAYRLALQTREQHIRREKATSNICTAQVLLAVMASMYGVYHGPDGLRAIATRTHRYAAVLAAGLRAGGIGIGHEAFFDTVLAVVPGRAGAVVEAAAGRGILLRRIDDDRVGIACDETTTRAHLVAVWAAFGVDRTDVTGLDEGTDDALPAALRRES